MSFDEIYHMLQTMETRRTWLIVGSLVLIGIAWDRLDRINKGEKIDPITREPIEEPSKDKALDIIIFILTLCFIAFLFIEFWPITLPTF